MELELKDKVALVTGSSRGIGYSIAQRLYFEGCKVVFNARNDDEVKKASANFPGSYVVVGDVTNPENAKKIINEISDTIGHLDFLVCNVGSGASVAPGQETYDEWLRVLGLNFLSATNMVEQAQGLLAESAVGSIVCISSICGVEMIPGAPITYSVAKSALNAYVRGISKPLADRNIRINAVAPGNILFDTSVWSRKLKEDEEAVKAMLDRDVALSRLGSPREIADLVTYLLSSKAAFVTGQTWTIDGGQVRS